MADSEEGLVIRDCSNMAEVGLEPLAPSDPSNPDKPAQFDYITENIYISQTLQAAKDRKRAKRMVCECHFDPEQDEPEAACGEDCLNRLLMIECGSRCPCGEYCTNKNFQKAVYAKVEVFKTEKKGWGLRASSHIAAVSFVMEYCGEVCTIADFERRKEEYSRDKRRHYYFMSLKTDEILDATRKGNLSRFINHSCDPNCETQKWTVNGRLCIGFFTRRQVEADEELTFDYQFQRFGDVAQKCYCGANNCRGFLGQTKQAPPINRISNQHGDNSSPQSPSSSKRRGKQRAHTDADSVFEKEIFDIIGSSWRLKGCDQVVAISRTMLQAETPSQRTMLLQVVQATEDLGCLKKFLSLQGLRLLWSWMVDSAELCTSEALQFRIHILQTLAHLPVTSKNQLDESRVLPVVTRWAEKSRKTRGSITDTMTPVSMLTEEGRASIRKPSEGSLADSDVASGDAARVEDSREGAGYPAGIQDLAQGSARIEDSEEGTIEPAGIEDSGPDDPARIEDLGANDSVKIKEDTGESGSDAARSKHSEEAAVDPGKSIEDSKEGATPTVGVVCASGGAGMSNDVGVGERTNREIIPYTEDISEGDLSTIGDTDGRECALDSDAGMDAENQEERTNRRDVSREGDQEASFSIPTTDEAPAVSQSNVTVDSSNTNKFRILTGETTPTEVSQMTGVVGNVSEPTAGLGEATSTREETETNNLEGPAKESNLEGLAEESSLEGPTEESNLEGPAEESNLEGLAEESDLKGPTEESNLEGPVEESDLKGPAKEGNLEGPTEESNLKGPTEESNWKGPAEEKSNLEGPTEESNLKGPAEESNLEGPAEESDLKGPAEESNLEGPAEESNLEGPAEESNLKGPAEESDLKGPAEESNLEGPAEESNLEGPAEESNLKGPAEESDLKGPAEESNLEGPAEESNLEGPAEESNLKGPAEESNLKGPAEESDLKGPAGESNLEGPAEESNLESPTPMEATLSDDYHQGSTVAAAPSATSANMEEATCMLTTDSPQRLEQITGLPVEDLQNVSTSLELSSVICSDSSDPRSAENTEVSQPADLAENQEPVGHTDVPVPPESSSSPPVDVEPAPKERCPMESGAAEAITRPEDSTAAALLDGEVHLETTFEMELHQFTEDSGADKTTTIDDVDKDEFASVETDDSMEVDDVAVKVDQTREVGPPNFVDAAQEAVPLSAVHLEGQGVVGKDARCSVEDLSSAATYSGDGSTRLVSFSMSDLPTKEKEEDASSLQDFTGIKASQACEDIRGCHVPSESEESDSMPVQDGYSTVDDGSPIHLDNLSAPKPLPDLYSDSSSMSSDQGSSSNLMRKLFMAKRKESTLKFSHDDFEGSASDSSQSVGSPSDSLGPNPFPQSFFDKDWHKGDKQRTLFPLSKSSTLDSAMKEDDRSSTGSLGLARHEPVATHCPSDGVVGTVATSDTVNTYIEECRRLAVGNDDVDMALCTVRPDQQTEETSKQISDEMVPDASETIVGLKNEVCANLRAKEVEVQSLQKDLSDNDDNDRANSMAITAAELEKSLDSDIPTDAGAGSEEKDYLPPDTSSNVEMEVGTADSSEKELPDAKSAQVPEESSENSENKFSEHNKDGLDFRTSEGSVLSPDVPADGSANEAVLCDTKLVGRAEDVSQAIGQLEESMPDDEERSEREKIGEANLLDASSLGVDCEAMEVDDEQLQLREGTVTLEEEGVFLEREEAEDASGSGSIAGEKKDSELSQEQTEGEVSRRTPSEVTGGEEESLFPEADRGQVKGDCSAVCNTEMPVDQSEQGRNVSTEESEHPVESFQDASRQFLDERSKTAQDLVVPGSVDLGVDAVSGGDSTNVQPTTDLIGYECVDSEEGTTGSSTGADEEWEGGGEKKGPASPEISEECKELQKQVEETARQLLAKWSSLKEVFRIPKKAAKPVTIQPSPSSQPATSSSPLTSRGSREEISSQQEGHKEEVGGAKRRDHQDDHREEEGSRRRDDHWDDENGTRRRGSRRSRWDSGGESQQHHSHHHHHHNQHQYHHRHRDRDRSPIRKTSVGYSSSGHTPSPALISPPCAPLLASPQVTPSYPTQQGRVGGGMMARVLQQQQQQHLPGQNLLAQQQQMVGGGGTQQPANVMRPPYVPTPPNKPLLPQGSLSTSFHPSAVQPPGQVGQTTDRRMSPAVPPQQASSVFGQSVGGLGGEASAIQRFHLGMAGQPASGLSQQQQPLGHAHQQGLGHTHQQGIRHAYQQGIGQAHHQGIVHTHQQQGLGNTRATGHAQQLGLGVVKQQGSPRHAQLGLQVSGQVQQQHCPTNVLQPPLQPSGQPQVQATPIGAIPNQVHTQFQPMLQSRSANQLQGQQQTQMPGILQAGQQQQQQLLTGHAQNQNLVQLQTQPVPGGRPQFQSQNFARQTQSPLQTTPIDRNQPAVAGLVQTPLLQGSNLGPQQQAHGQASQAILTGATGQNFSPAQTHLASTQRALMQPSLQGTPLQSSSVLNQQRGGGLSPAAAPLAANMHIQVQQANPPPSQLSTPPLMLPGSNSQKVLLPHPQSALQTTPLGGGATHLPQGQVNSVHNPSANVVASANVAGIGTGLLVQQGVVGGAMLQQLQQQPLEILGGQGSPVQGSLLHSATLQGGNQIRTAGTVAPGASAILPLVGRGDAAPTLPVNWKMARDAKGKPYYYHVITRKTQWEVPVSSDEGTIGMDLSTPEPEAIPEESGKVGPHTPTEDDGSFRTPDSPERGPRTPPGSGSSDTWHPPRSRESRNRKRKSRSPSPGPKTPTEAPPSSKRHRSSDDDDIFRNTPVSSPIHQLAPHMTFGLNTPPFSSESLSPHPRTPPFSPPTSSATPSDWREQADQLWDTPFFTRKKKSLKKEEQMEKESFRHMLSKVVTSCLDSHRKSDCKYGRITCAEDFKYLARKLTYGLTEKEANRKKAGRLEFTNSVKTKVKEYIRQYMKKTGPVYKKQGNSP